MLPHMIFDEEYSVTKPDDIKNLDTPSQELVRRVNALLLQEQKEMSKADMHISIDVVWSLLKTESDITVYHFFRCLQKFVHGQKKDFIQWKNDNGALDAKSIISEELKNYHVTRQLFAKYKTQPAYIQRLHSIIEWTGIPTGKNRKPKAPEKFKNDPMALIDTNQKFHSDFECLCKEYVSKFSEGPLPVLEPFQVFEDAKPFDLDRNGEDGGYMDGKVKGLPRVIQKFFYKYQLDGTAIVDIIRATFVFSDVTSLYQGLYLAIQFFSQKNGGDIESSLWLKDRFVKPVSNEYRDIILQVKVPGSDIWAEIQFHLREALTNKGKQHKLYEVMRHFPNASKITDAVVKYSKTTGKTELSRKGLTKVLRVFGF